MLDQYTLLGDR